MKKILLAIFAFFLLQINCLAQSGITFVYINGSNNNDAKMKNWYENGVKKLHPELKKAFEKDPQGQKYFLKNGQYSINQNPEIFFWGDKSHADLTFVENNLALSKTFSSFLAYEIRANLAKFLHDAIWIQKYHNMSPVLEDLHKVVMSESAKGNKIVLYGYSAGSFVTYEYLQTRLPYIKVNDFFNNVGLSKLQRDFVAKHPKKDTCMAAIGDANLAVITASGHIVPNQDNNLFDKYYENLDKATDTVCAPKNSIKGIVNFASPLVLFYSDLSDPRFELTYYNRLLFKYIFENNMFWLTVNYRSDPLGFPGGRNLSISEIENSTGVKIKANEGFIYDQSDTWSHNSALTTHTSYWNTRKTFSKAVVRAYVNGYKHEYDDNLKAKTVKKYEQKFNLIP